MGQARWVWGFAAEGGDGPVVLARALDLPLLLEFVQGADRERQVIHVLAARVVTFAGPGAQVEVDVGAAVGEEHRHRAVVAPHVTERPAGRAAMTAELQGAGLVVARPHAAGLPFRRDHEQRRSLERPGQSRHPVLDRPVHPPGPEQEPERVRDVHTPDSPAAPARSVLLPGRPARPASPLPTCLHGGSRSCLTRPPGRGTIPWFWPICCPAPFSATPCWWPARPG